MKFNLRTDLVTPEHVKATLFANGANCGELCLSRDEHMVLVRIMNLGAVISPDPVEVTAKVVEEVRRDRDHT